MNSIATSNTSKTNSTSNKKQEEMKMPFIVKYNTFECENCACCENCKKTVFECEHCEHCENCGGFAPEGLYEED